MRARGALTRILFAIALLVVTSLAPSAGGGRLLAPGRAAAAACEVFPATGKQVCDPFLTYWRDHGGLAQQGYPLSDAFLETNPTDGRRYRTQYFERARFEHHPENAPPFDVLLGLVGNEQFFPEVPDDPAADLRRPLRRGHGGPRL